MTFNSIELSPKFNDDYFKLNSLLNKKDSSDETTTKEDTTKNSNEESTTEKDETTINESEITEETATIDDIIYPMYLPDNTYLTSQEKIDTDTGERLILTFDGDNPFTLVEETISKSDESLIIPTSGEFEFLSDVIGVVSEKSVNWDSNGISYYVVSDVLETSELIEIAKSISVLPVSK